MEAGGIQVNVVRLRPGGVEQSVLPAPPNPPDLVVAFGSAAASAAAKQAGETPLIASMVLLDNEIESLRAGRPGRPSAAVVLDVPPTLAFARLRAAFPDRRRVAVVYNPNRAPWDPAEFASAARAHGIALEMVPCTEPRCVLDAVASRRGRADLLWCLPDAALYPPATVTPLLLASIRARVPIVGFSESFVAAGALAGFYADQWDVGRQTAELAKAGLAGPPASGITPARTVHFAVNLRIVRLLGVEWSAPPGVELRVLR
jgi:ABC-type uncharacterized transport system substrate-binding protein